MLDIEPLDPRAGGYTWTATDGSLQIGPARKAQDVAKWTDGDLLDAVPAFEEALSEIAADMALAWR